MNSHSHDLADVQLLVQQALGRCLLRIQQYEKLLKNVVARSELHGALEEFPSLQQSKIDTVQTKTLGQLVRLLTDDYQLSPSLLKQMTHWLISQGGLELERG